MSDSDIVKDFLVESYENLDRLDRELVGLEKDPQDREALASVFRTIHTIKGTCGFLGFSKLEAVAHVGENLLSRLRDQLLTLNPEITTTLLNMVDAVRQMLSNIDSTGEEGERDDSKLIAELTRLQQTPGVNTETPALNIKTTASATVSVPVSPVAPASVDPSISLGDILMQQAGVTALQIDRALQAQKAGDPRRLGEILVDQKVLRPTDLVNALLAQKAARGQASDSSIRVDVGLLDKLMNLVGELVLARNQVLQFTSQVKDSKFHATSQRLNLITTELQEGVMKTRMQPIDNIWSKFPRTVRDVALSCGKEVRIEMEGKETELDKTIIEAIKDPLTHLVRNSVDHGIEVPEVRRAAGKDPVGRLYLRAYHEGGQVNIEISDDGAGLDQERIRRKAVEKSLVGPEQAERMSDGEIFNLIFLPGFSTAEQVTNVSGRGVGMDVVKTNIEKIGGTVDVQSKRGTGTTVHMKIPLTLAIVPALIVSSGGERYAIPQTSLLELVRLEPGQALGGIEMVHGAPVHRLRGRLLPVVYLDRELQIAGKGLPAIQRDGTINIVVVQADGRQFGLVVDEVNDTEEIVVKPLSTQLKSVKAFAGSSIMGDGKVVLILDVLGLAQRAGVVTEARDRSVAEEAVVSAETVPEKQTFLIFAGLGDSRMAIPLSTLARLEEFPVAQVEMSGGQWVTQYRGEILTLVRLSVALQERRTRLSPSQVLPAPGSAPIQVLVLHHEGRSFGLVVERILDIVEDRAEVKAAAPRPGILYSVLIGGRITELLDIPAILLSVSKNIVCPSRSTMKAAAGRISYGANLTILYLLSRQVAVRSGIERRAGSPPANGDDSDAAGPLCGQWPDQPARANCHRNRFAATSGVGASPDGHGRDECGNALRRWSGEPSGGRDRRRRRGRQ
jgi:two-component system, chemotaxis family, sensor kinase CheA